MGAGSAGPGGLLGAGGTDEAAAAMVGVQPHDRVSGRGVRGRGEPGKGEGFRGSGEPGRELGGEQRGSIRHGLVLIHAKEKMWQMW